MTSRNCSGPIQLSGIKFPNNWWDRQKFNFPTYVDVEFAKQTTQVEINIMLDREFAVQDLDHNDWLRLERSKRIKRILASRTAFISCSTPRYCGHDLSNS